MKEKLLVGVMALALFVIMIAASVAAVKTEGPSASNGLSHPGEVSQLYLYEKDPLTWDPIAGGAWGKMTFDKAGTTFDFVFNGHGLDAGDNYTLIYYPDPWPGAGLICFGSDTANAGGNVHIAGSVETNTDLPAAFDANYPNGAKIWLVLSGDVKCDAPSQMTGWNPTEYLFEYNLVKFDDTG